MEKLRNIECYQVKELARALKYAGYEKNERRKKIKKLSRERTGTSESYIVAAIPLIFTAGFATMVGTFLGTSEIGRQIAREINSLTEPNFVDPYLRYSLTAAAILAESYLFKKTGEKLFSKSSKKLEPLLKTLEINRELIQEKKPLPKEIVEGTGIYRNLGLENLIPS